ncbi:hypothetical protein J6590_016070 [Homalodisca vitripennis]|nr:hypothetical protein J6590_016070 [Homalodisca vitripennis]
MSMIDRAGEVTKQAGDSDFVLMVGGSNAISNQTNLELGSGLDNLAEGLKGRVLWVETPYRFDSPDRNEGWNTPPYPKHCPSYTGQFWTCRSPKMGQLPAETKVSSK